VFYRRVFKLLISQHLTFSRPSERCEVKLQLQRLFYDVRTEWLWFTDWYV